MPAAAPCAGASGPTIAFTVGSTRSFWAAQRSLRVGAVVKRQRMSAAWPAGAPAMAARGLFQRRVAVLR